MRPKDSETEAAKAEANTANTYHALLDFFGSQRWWPTTTANKETEIIIGAILTQNTSWKNVEMAISNLASAGMVDFGKIAAATKEKVARLIRPSGYFNQKAERLQLFAQHVCYTIPQRAECAIGRSPICNYGGNVNKLLQKDVGELRSELLQLKGIGPETADSIILYAAKKPVFVVDAYTKRIFSRIGICSSDVSYDGLQQLLVNGLPENMRTASVYGQYHALLVELGKKVCTKSNPLCASCPLLGICSHGKAAVKAARKKNSKV